LYSWLLDFIHTDHSIDTLADALTMSGTEVTSVQNIGFTSEHVVVGEILSSEKHPQADRLSVCSVAIGSGTLLQIVCGAKNYRIGDRVPVALPGAVLPSGLKIEKTKLRGVVSEGMMCSAKELSLPQNEDGLLILEPFAELGSRVDALFPADYIFEIEATPNRPDLLSHLGIARELVGIGAARWKMQPNDTEAVSCTVTDSTRINITDSSFCSFYSATIFREIPKQKTPSWMARRLMCCGQKSIHYLVDVTNYVLHHMGQPMHVFDLDKIHGDTLFVRKAKNGEILDALDGKAYNLSESDYVIADAKQCLALAGIIGGKNSSVNSITRNVLLEVAHFSASAIRKTSRRLNLSTDSSYRFERGIDPELQAAALKFTLDLLRREFGITPSQQAISTTSSSKISRTVRLRLTKVEKMLGITLPPTQVTERLTALGFQPEKFQDEIASLWRAPSWRLDIDREADLIEEIARTISFDKIPSIIFHTAASATCHDQEFDYHNCIRKVLSGLGWYEVLLHPLTDQRNADLKITNPMSSEHVGLRNSLLRHMLSTIAQNTNAGNCPLRLFSIGKVFFADAKENYHLGLIATGATHQDNWLEKPRNLDAFDIKSALAAVGIVDCPIQYIGLSLMREYGLRTPIAYAEVRIDQPTVNNHKFRAWPEYPFSRRDVAVVVDKSTPASHVLKQLFYAETQLLERAQIIDLYIDPEGVHIPKNKKTITIACIYRAKDRTLTENEIDAAHDAIKKAILGIPGAALRV